MAEIAAAGGAAIEVQRPPDADRRFAGRDDQRRADEAVDDAVGIGMVEAPFEIGRRALPAEDILAEAAVVPFKIPFARSAAA
jgi:hypothetical protein